MIQPRLLLLGTLLMVLALASGAQAQYGYYGSYEDDAQSVNIHAGMGFFSGDTEDDTTWVIGIEYEGPAGDPAVTTSYVTLGVDYIPVDTVAGDTESMIPILVGYRKYGNIGGNKAFFGIALGARWASDDIPEMEVEDGFDFAWGVNTGVNFTSEFFAMLRYLAGTEPSDDGVFTVELGYRF